MSGGRSSRVLRPGKRLKRDADDAADYKGLLASFSPIAERLPSRSLAKVASEDDRPSTIPRANPKELDGHIRNNAVFLFYPEHSCQPRVRLFGACNSTQKLFAQAPAGEVFEESSKATKVLSIRIGGLEKARAVVEDDEQDFEDLETAIKAALCWVRVEGTIQGSCTVEVRANS